MDIRSALRASSERAGWSPAKIAAEAGVGEQAARRWLSGEAIPSGDTLLRLMERLPGFCDRLGFTHKSKPSTSDNGGSVSGSQAA